MSWDFRVGQRVVWVLGKPQPNWPEYCRTYLKRGRVYVIAGIHSPMNPGVKDGFLSFTDSPLHPNGNPYQFDERGFRPLKESTTDIDVFTAMLNPSKQRVDA